MGDAYHALHPETQLRYLPEGTTESARKILAGVGDLGGGDAPTPENELKRAAVPVLEVPTILIGIAIVYNLPNTPGELHLSGPVVADVFLGKVKSWNDPAIVKLNPTMKLPAQPIQVVHRTDGKGANYILSDYLCKLSPEFLTKAGRGESPKWPVGGSAARSQDMADKVRATSWSIGYTEANLAQRASLRMARIKNAAGDFVLPTTNSISAAALESKVHDDFRASLTNAPGKDSYPIASFTWLYIPVKSKDPSGPRRGCVSKMGLWRGPTDRERTRLRYPAGQIARQSDRRYCGGSLKSSHCSRFNTKELAAQWRCRIAL